MDALTEFLAMGGYAIYVWPCVLLTVAVLIGLASQARRQHREARRRVRRRLEQEEQHS